MSETEDKPELEAETPDVEEASSTQDQNDSGIDKDIEKLSVSENDNKPEEEEIGKKKNSVPSPVTQSQLPVSAVL